MSDSTDPPIVARAFRAGLIGNVGLAVAKLGVGWLAGSMALVADGFHSFADVLINIGAWIAHRFSKEGPDEDHHYGHGKLEAFGGFFVGMFLLAGGVVVVVEGLRVEPRPEEGWSAWVALGVAAVSILVNVLLAGISMAGARAGRSAGLAAVARDNIADALSSLIVFAAVLGSTLGLSWPEPVATVLIGLLIAWLGARTIREGFDVLMDRSDPAVRRHLVTVVREVPGVLEVHRMRVRTAGGHTLVDLEISVDGDLTVSAGHDIAHAAEDAIAAADDSVREVHVHVNPVLSGARGGGPEPAVEEEGPDE